MPPLNFKYIRMCEALLWPPMSTNAKFYRWNVAEDQGDSWRNQYPYDIKLEFLAIIFIVSTVPVQGSRKVFELLSFLFGMGVNF